MRLFTDWGLLLFSALTRSRVAQSFPPSLPPSFPPSVPPSAFLPPSLPVLFLFFLFFLGSFLSWALGVGETCSAALLARRGDDFSLASGSS